jgi:ABC-type ATPase involved in cell division
MVWDRKFSGTSPSISTFSSFQFLTGPSGAGKTTLLKLLFLSLKPTRGLIRMFDRDIASIPREDLPADAPSSRHRLPGFPVA